MNVRFGNLSTLAFEDRLQIDLKPEDRLWIEEHRTDEADFTEDDKLHIFSLPLGIVAGHDIGPELVNRLRQYEFSHQFYVETKESEQDPDSKTIAVNV